MVRNPVSGESITPVIPANPRQILISNNTSSDAANEVNLKPFRDIKKILCLFYVIYILSPHSRDPQSSFLNVRKLAGTSNLKW